MKRDGLRTGAYQFYPTCADAVVVAREPVVLEWGVRGSVRGDEVMVRPLLQGFTMEPLDLATC
jgi:hypothetical protein